MIAKLRGIIDTILLDSVILDVNGVGYQVFASSRTLSGLGGQGDVVTLWIETHVREDHIHLFGFMDQAEQQWYKLLTSVQGVGAKVGLAILSACPVDQLGFIIGSGDKAAITRADGVGPKLGLRIITELKDKVAKLDVAVSINVGSEVTNVNSVSVEGNQNDALSALLNLGYGRSEACSALSQVAKSNDNIKLSVEEFITQALKELSA